MAISWQQVEQKPEFQKLPKEQKQAAQEQYFNDVVVPQAGENAEAAKVQFFNQYNYAAPEEMGIVDSIKDVFTGDSRTTPELEALDHISDSPELDYRGGSDAGINASRGLFLTGDSDRRQKIIKEQFPNAVFREDEKGNTIVSLPSGEYALQKPGVEMQDVGRMLGLGVAMLPISRGAAALSGGARIAAGALGGAAEGAATEAGLSHLGGGFEPSNIALGAVTGGALESVPVGLKALRDRGGRQATQATEEATAAEAARMGNTLSPEAGQVRQQQLAENLVGATQARRPGEQLKELAGDVGVDPERLAAAERLGVADALLPSQLGRNQQYIEIEQGLASIPGSRLSEQSKAAIDQVSQKADDLITEFGGTTDKAGLSDKLKESIFASIDDLGKQSDDIYKAIDQAIPKNTRVTPEDSKALTDAIQQSALDLGGMENLDPLERKLLEVATGNPTYTLLDRERKKIGDALRKSTGAYKDAPTGELKRLYGLLTDTQGKVAERMGAADMWKTAKGLVSQRKQLEDDSLYLLGRQKTGAIMPKLGRAVKRLSAGDYKDFDQTMKALPKDLREEAVLSALNDAFTMGSRGQKQLSAPGFVDWYNGITRNKAAKDRIYKNLPEGAGKRLDDIAKVAEGIRNASKERITTGRIQGLLDNFATNDGVLSKVYGMTISALDTKITGGIGGTIHGLLSSGKKPIMKAADDFLTDPKFQDAVKAYASSGVRSNQRQAAAAKALERSARYQSWYNTLPTENKQAIAKAGIMAYLFGDE